MATNRISHQQKVDSAELGTDEIPELINHDTGKKSETNIEHYIRYNDKLETIPEESDKYLLVTVQGDSDGVDTIPYIPGDSEDEQFNTAIDDTSDDPMIVMGEPLTTAFVSSNVCIPTEKVGCLQVTNQLGEFLNHFPPESKEKAFEQIYEILQVLEAYLIDNPQQHIHCMSPDNDYVSLIMYAITIEIDLCNFPAIWAVLSILLDTQSNTLQHVKSLQQVMNNYYDMCPMDVMSRLEHQASIIMKAMYDSINNDNFDNVSGDIDRVSGAVDNDYDTNDYDKDEYVMPYDKDEYVMPYDKDEYVMPYDKDEYVMPYDKDEYVMPYDKDQKEMPHDSDNESMLDDNENDQMPTKYANDYETVSDKVKHDKNMKSYEQNDVGKKDVVIYKRVNCIPTKEKRPIETRDIDDDFIREYKSMEYKQIHDYYEAQRHIQSAMEGDTPVKTSQNRQCIDNVRDYDREHDRILNSVRHRLDLGPNMLPGAQQYTTVESAAALRIQDKFKGKYDENTCNKNGQYRNELYKRAENMVPQLDGTYNVSDDSDTDSHNYLDLASSNIIAHRTRGQKQRHEIDTRAHTNRHLALKEGTKPNANIKMRRQKVPDDEDIDINKIAQGDRPKEDRNKADITAKQYKEKEAKRLELEKVKRIQGQNDSKNIEAKRHMIEKAKIEALIEKHRLCTPKTSDKVNKSSTGKNTIEKGQEGTRKGKPPYKKATKDIQIKKSCKKGTEATDAEKGKADTLLGDPMANTTTGIEKAKEKGQKDKIGIDDIGIFKFIFKGLPELPELEGVDEDRLKELQNAVQEQLHKRDKERERNITKRVQEFEKTFDFVNSHLLKGVATMAELTKSDSRQPMGKIKPTDKMVMMPSLFDGTKPATSKQHYERFNLYINFQTKSGHLTDPVKEGIDLFEHTLDKTALVWFQMNKSKFKDLTMLKMMFLQRYNPWGKTKREQLQSWNILSFNPKTTDVDEHIDLINTLGDIVDQKEEAKKEKFIETMPTMIQTHLITCKDWDTVKDTTKSLEHIIMKCDPPTPAMPMMATGATVLGLYSHIAHSVDKEEGDIPQPFKGAKPKQTRGRGKPKGKPQDQRQNPPKIQEVDETYNYEIPNNYYHNAPSQSRGSRPYNGQSGN